VKLVNRHNYRVGFNDQINFDNYLIDQSHSNSLNYIDYGGAMFIDLELAINEFDPTLRSNLNFRNPDSFKMLATSAGVEELRAAVHYQQMHKQLLIVAV